MSMSREDAEQSVRRLGEKMAEVVAIEREVRELESRRARLLEEIKKMSTHAADAHVVISRGRE